MQFYCMQHTRPELRGRGTDGLLLGSLQKAVQAGAANAQKLCGAHSIAFTSVQNAANVLSPDFFQRQRAPGVLRMDVVTGGSLEIFREVIHVYKFVYGGQAGAGND